MANMLWVFCFTLGMDGNVVDVVYAIVQVTQDGIHHALERSSGGSKPGNAVREDVGSKWRDDCCLRNVFLKTLSEDPT